MSHLPSHGGDIYQAALNLGLKSDSIHDFSTNSNEFARAITQDLINGTPYPFDRYPDPDSTILRDKIARHEGTAPENIMVGNGSSELIFLAIQAMRPSSALLIGPIFMEYARACEALGIPYEILALPPETGFTFGRAELHALWRSRADLAILCTPNNPTGVNFENLAFILEALPCQRLLVDSTYREFLWGDSSYQENYWKACQRSLRPGTGVVSLNSFTKFFHCAGVRLGYVVADRSLINTMESLRAPWTVSAFAQEMGCKFLNKIDEYRSVLPELRLSQARMTEELCGTGLFEENLIFAGPSFITMGLRCGLNAMALKNHLLKWHVLIRVCDNIPGMPPNFVRIQVRPCEQWEPLMGGLNTWNKY